MKFILPNKQCKKDVLSFYQEFERKKEECIGFKNHTDYEIWMQGMINRHEGNNLPDGYVRENFYLCYDKDELIGVFSLKFVLTEYLLNFGGHIRYAVRPSKQHQGYATKILNEGLQICKKYGFQSVLCVCDADNFRSEKVIVRNGGILENETYDPIENVEVKRYWITT